MSSVSISNDLQEIISDNTSGSSELLDKLNSYLNKNRREINDELISLLKNSFSDFQTIISYLNDLNVALNENTLTSFFEKQAEYKLKIYDRIYAKLQDKISSYNTFITLSNSKTVFEVLKQIAITKDHIKVFVSEGRPICEGRKLAEKLTDNNIEVILITKAQIYSIVQKCDCAIIGADIILATGNVINKVGSNLLALTCKQFNRPIFVISDKTKLSDDATFAKKKMPAKEIYEEENNNITINNYYLEEVTNDLITDIITD